MSSVEPLKKKLVPQYFFEYLLVAVSLLLIVPGFWAIYVGETANPNLYHHLHVVTNVIWILLLLYQLSLVSSRRYADHRRVGLIVLMIAPLLVASTALLSVHSAHKALVSGRGDFLIVQNVMVTLELGFFILLAFVLRKRRNLHASMLLSTLILFMGIALFFTLLSFVPQFKIEGPETFDRFAAAGITAQGIVLLVAFAYFLKDFRNGWPYFLAALFFLLNEAIRSTLAERKLIDPLTELVGSMNQPLTFIGSFVVLFALLAATGIRSSKQSVVA